MTKVSSQIRLRFVLYLVAFGILLIPLDVRAQQGNAKSQAGKPSAKSPSKAAAAGTVVIGTVAAERGTTAAIPLYYQASKNSSVRSLHLVLDFVSNSIKFARADNGVAGGGQDLEVTAEAKELPPDDKKIQHSQLTVNLNLPASSDKKSLPEGLLTFLNFRIPDDAKPFSILLSPVSITAEDPTKKSVEVAAESGKVIVSVPDAPLANCFFFTH